MRRVLIASAPLAVMDKPKRTTPTLVADMESAVPKIMKKPARIASVMVSHLSNESELFMLPQLKLDRLIALINCCISVVSLERIIRKTLISSG